MPHKPTYKEWMPFFGFRWYPSKMRFMPFWSFELTLIFRKCALFQTMHIFLCVLFFLSTSFIFRALNVIRFSYVGLYAALVWRLYICSPTSLDSHPSFWSLDVMWSNYWSRKSVATCYWFQVLFHLNEMQMSTSTCRKYMVNIKLNVKPDIVGVHKCLVLNSIDILFEV